MKGMLPSLLLTLCLSGCAAVTNQDSRGVDSSALITISHVYTGTELEHLDSVQAQQEALMKCQLHGYSRRKQLVQSGKSVHATPAITAAFITVSNSSISVVA